MLYYGMKRELSFFPSFSLFSSSSTDDQPIDRSESCVELCFWFPEHSEQLLLIYCVLLTVHSSRFFVGSCEIKAQRGRVLHVRIVILQDRPAGGRAQAFHGAIIFDIIYDRCRHTWRSNWPSAGIPSWGLSI
jgi:hypothetical protein